MHDAEINSQFMGSLPLCVSMCMRQYFTIGGSDLLSGWKTPARCLKASEDAVLIIKNETVNRNISLMQRDL